MLRRLFQGAACLTSIALAGPAAADGAWTTMLHAARYADLFATGDTVWCATGEAGLLRFSRASGEFEQLAREPGGLANNRLTALALDASRRLWIGTVGAGASLLEANRSSWGLLNAFDGLPSDTVTVFEAAGDTVWIGTNAGIALWNGREISGVLPDGTNPSPFADNRVAGIAQWNGDVWVATRSGVYRSPLAGGLATWTAVNSGLPSADVGGLACDGQSLMALSARSVLRFDSGGDQWLPAGVPGEVFSLSDDGGVVAAAGRGGIFRWNGAGWDLLDATLVSGATPESTFVVSLAEDGRFFAANGQGLHQQPAGAGPWDRFVPPGPPGNNILNVDIDGPRTYVTTLDDGIGRYDGTGWRNWLPSRGVVSSDTTFRRGLFPFALLVDRSGRKWVGCWESAMEVFDDATSPPQFTHLWASVPGSPCSGDTVVLHTLAWASCMDSTGGHWFGMNEFGRCEGPAIGLEYYDSAGVYVTGFRADNSDLRGDKIHALTASQNGRVWVGYSGEGIDYFDWPPESGTLPSVRTVSGTEGFVIAGLAAHGDAVWAFTSSEVLRCNTSGSLEASFTVPAGPSPQTVRPVDVAPDGTAWVGTLNGIRLYRPDGTTQDFNTRNSPLAADEVTAIRIDPVTKVVWIGTAGGMNRYQIDYLPPPQRLPRLELHAYPNPARLTALGVSLRLRGNAASYRGGVYDIGGRLIARFAVGANGGVIWNGRDTDGRLVKPGIYLVHAEAGGRTGTVRVALVR